MDMKQWEMKSMKTSCRPPARPPHLYSLQLHPEKHNHHTAPTINKELKKPPRALAWCTTMFPPSGAEEPPSVPQQVLNFLALFRNVWQIQLLLQVSSSAGQNKPAQAHHSATCAHQQRCSPLVRTQPMVFFHHLQSAGHVCRPHQRPLPEDQVT